MRKGLDTEIKVGLFVTLGLGLISLSVLLLGGSNSLFSSKNHYHVHLANVEGLIPGAKVVVGGVQVGSVSTIDFDPERKDVKLTLEVNRNQSAWVKTDSAIEILTQGMLGDKFVSITRGSEDKAALPEGSELPYRPSSGITQFLTKSDQLLVSLQGIAGSVDRILKGFEARGRSEAVFENLALASKHLSAASEKLNTELTDLHLKAASKNLNAILEKVNSGQGTLGALVNDPGLYDDVRALTGGANRNRVMRNLVRQTIKKSEESEAEELKKVEKSPLKK